MSSIAKLENYSKIIGFSGNRKMNPKTRPEIRREVRKLLESEDPKTTAVLNGGARGFDLLATREALRQGFNVYIINPYGEDWRYEKLDTKPIEHQYKTSGNAMFHERNEIIAKCSDFVLLYNEMKGNGTESTIRFCEKHNTDHVVL